MEPFDYNFSVKSNIMNYTTNDFNKLKKCNLLLQSEKNKDKNEENHKDNLNNKLFIQKNNEKIEELIQMKSEE